MNSLSFTHLWWSTVLVIVGLVVCRHLFVSGFPQTMDGELHLARSQQVRTALDQGQWPPFWAPNLNFGLGHPVLILSYPLFTLLSLPLLGAGLSAMLTTKLLIVALVIGGALGMYMWRRQDPWPAAVAALGYLSLPSISAAIFNRGSLGEITVFGIIPWLLLLLQHNQDSRPILLARAVVISLFLLSHNISVVLFAPILALVALSRRRSLWYWGSVAAGIGLSLWFWIPALGLVSQTGLAESSLSQITAGRFRTLLALVGLSGADPLVLKPIPETLGWLVPIGVVWSLTHLVKPTKPVVGWIATVIASIWLMTPASMVLWQHLPLEILQHPIRLLAVTGLAGCQLAYYLARKSALAGVVLMVVALVQLWSYQAPAFFLPYQDDILASFPLTTTAANELDPSWYQAMTYAALDTSWFTHGLLRVEPDSNARVVYRHVDGSRMVADLTLTTPSKVQFQRLWFPGWKLTGDGQELAPLEPQLPYGLVATELPAGSHRLELGLSRLGGIYGMGWLGTGLSVVGLGVILITTRSMKNSGVLPSSTNLDNSGA